MSWSLATPPGVISPTTDLGLRLGGLTRRGAAPLELACEATGKATVAAAAATSLTRFLRSSLNLERIAQQQCVGAATGIRDSRLPRAAGTRVAVVRDTERRIGIQDVLDPGG